MSVCQADLAQKDLPRSEMIDTPSKTREGNMGWYAIRSTNKTRRTAITLCLCGAVLAGACGGVVKKDETIFCLGQEEN